MGRSVGRQWWHGGTISPNGNYLVVGMKRSIELVFLRVEQTLQLAMLVLQRCMPLGLELKLATNQLVGHQTFVNLVE